MAVLALVHVIDVTQGDGGVIVTHYRLSVGGNVIGEFDPPASPAGANDSTIWDSVVSHAKAQATALAGVTFGPSDTVHCFHPGSMKS